MDGIAELQFDLKDESVNKFNELTLGELREAVTQLNTTPGIRGLMLTSAKKVFIVGADITEFTAWFDVPSAEFVQHILGIHEVFSALEGSAVSQRGGDQRICAGRRLRSNTRL